jgi:hypothetical protein
MHESYYEQSGQLLIIGGYAEKQPQDVRVNKVVELYNPDTDDRKYLLTHSFTLSFICIHTFSLKSLFFCFHFFFHVKR